MDIECFGLDHGLMEIREVQGNKKEPLFEAPRESFLYLMQSRLHNEGNARISKEETLFEDYIVKPGDTLWKIGVKMFKADPYQIAKENGIENPDRIFPGQKIRIYKPQPPPAQTVTASWYGKEYHSKPTASGERFDMHQNTVAHKTLPFGTQVRLINPENGRMAIGRVNDRGPFIRGRDIDLSFGLAERLGMVKKGVGKLIMEVL